MAAAIPGTSPSSRATATAACPQESQSLMRPLAQKWLGMASVSSHTA
jgi:hypothetical protein